MLNKAMIMGHMGKNAQPLKDKNGNQFAVAFTVATEEFYKEKETGERKKHTEWHNIICYNKNLFEMLEKYALKGRLVYVEGKLRTSQYTKDAEESKRYSTEILADEIRFPARDDKKETAE